jgi:hypothetical protein
MLGRALPDERSTDEVGRQGDLLWPLTPMPAKGQPYPGI